MILASPKDRPEFIPAGQDEVAPEERKAYTFRVPLLLDKVKLEREVVIAGGRRVGVLDSIAELANACRAVLAEDDPARDEFLAMISAYRETLVAAAEAVQAAREGETRDAAVRAWSDALSDPRMNALSIELRPHWPALREIEADGMVYPFIRGAAAARLFLVGWRGFPGKLRLDGRGVHETSLEQIPEAHLVAIGAFVDGLFKPTETERKNSASPHGGASDTGRSPAASSQP